ncbi:hypothetical protein N657DRAFT_674191 [Parathielavia appendiculata]|uniref:Uncharacterized protein n=1 Tax=Parathielavia appendiculata TaxID=2587402 RepID=A0AAN6Z005_9PEZI|nr:hypothetical protein N657DRAFT_674191 [Parathielavia appendiculata]
MPRSLPDDPWPSNCASTRTFTRCMAPGDEHIVCATSSFCAATSTPAPPTPTPSDPSSRRWHAVLVALLVRVQGHAGTDYCGDRSVFEMTDSGATLQNPEFSAIGPRFVKAHGRSKLKYDMLAIFAVVKG